MAARDAKHVSADHRNELQRPDRGARNEGARGLEPGGAEVVAPPLQRVAHCNDDALASDKEPARVVRNEIAGGDGQEPFTERRCPGASRGESHRDHCEQRDRSEPRQQEDRALGGGRHTKEVEEELPLREPVEDHRSNSDGGEDRASCTPVQAPHAQRPNHREPSGERIVCRRPRVRVTGAHAPGDHPNGEQCVRVEQDRSATTAGRHKFEPDDRHNANERRRADCTAIKTSRGALLSVRGAAQHRAHETRDASIRIDRRPHVGVEH